MLSASLAALVLAALTMALPAQAQDGEAEIDAAIQEIVDRFNAGDADAFADLFTDEGLFQFVEDPSITAREDAIAAVEEFMGFAAIELIDARDIEVSGDTASAIVELDLGGFVTIDQVEFTQTGGDWLVSGYATGVEQPEPEEIPAGYETVHVDLLDYEFEFDASQISVGDDIAFEAENVGEEPHELVLVKVPADLDLEEALSSPEPPEGIEDIAFTFVNPGGIGVAVAPESLEAGRYVMLCFVETEEGVPHVALGMIEEFILESDDDDDDAPAAPETGTGTASSPTGSDGLLAAGIGLIVLTLGGGVAARAVVVAKR